jgi:hypothetical protein
MAEVNEHVALYNMAQSHMNYPDVFRRFFGETENNAEPMISGFGVVFFTAIPEAITNKAKLSSLLTAVTNNFELPDMTLDAITYEGRDGGAWHVPGAVKMSSNDLTFTMWELTGLPVYHSIANWITLMRNPQYGYMTETTWHQKNYKGKILYASCTPDMIVQWAKVYSGIWPVDLKDSVFKYDQSQEKVEYQVTFKFDHYPYMSTDINLSAQSLVDSSLRSLTSIIRGKYDSAASQGIATGDSFSSQSAPPGGR